MIPQIDHLARHQDAGREAAAPPALCRPPLAASRHPELDLARRRSLARRLPRSAPTLPAGGPSPAGSPEALPPDVRRGPRAEEPEEHDDVPVPRAALGAAGIVAWAGDCEPRAAPAAGWDTCRASGGVGHVPRQRRVGRVPQSQLFWYRLYSPFQSSPLSLSLSLVKKINDSPWTSPRQRDDH